jgi:catechol 2,3-dioxygenase
MLRKIIDTTLNTWRKETPLVADPKNGSPVRDQVLPAESYLGPVHLGVTDMDRAVAMWTKLMGVSVLNHEDKSTTLGVDDRSLIVLQADATAPVAKGRTGLYHVALHFESRREFARAVARLLAHRYTTSPIDHVVTETSYLRDPDGNGIELTFETPSRGEILLLPDGMPATRTSDGRYTSGRDPLDLKGLMAELPEGADLDAPIQTGVKVGHVHLQVANLENAIAFYRDVIGFPLLLNMRRIGMADFDLNGAAPHAIAINIWAGEGASPAPKHAAGLRHFTLCVPAHREVEELAERLRQRGWPFQFEDGTIQVLDPSANSIRVTSI